MKRYAGSIVLAALLLIAAGSSQPSLESPASTGAQQSASSVVADLRREALHVEAEKLSQVFTTLADRAECIRLAMTDEQIALVRRLEVLTREIIKSWLTRGLDDTPPPASDTLAERLGEPGVALRKRLTDHADAIVLQGILDERQSRLLLRKLNRKAPALLKGRHGVQALEPVDDEESVIELAERIRNAAERRRGSRVGAVFHAVLGTRGYREMYPNGVQHLTPLQRGFVDAFIPRVWLPSNENELAERLNKLAGDVYASWMLRDLEEHRLPPRRVLVHRLSETNERLATSVFAHAEAIALEGITTPQEAEDCLTAIWKGMGMRALLDPAVASRLRLSVSQRDQVVDLLDGKKAIADQWRSILPYGPATPATERLVAQARGQEAEVEDAIWDVLSPGQARVLARILKRPEPQAHKALPGKK